MTSIPGKSGAILALVAALAAALFLAAAPGGDDSWAGKRIMTKEAAPKMWVTDGANQQKVVGEVSDAILTVEQDSGALLQVRQKGMSGWIQKSEAVLLEDAIPFWTERIRRYPSDARAYAMRALAWRDNDDYGKALEDHDQSIRLQPENGVWYGNRGWTRKCKRDLDRAIQDYNEAIRLEPQDARAFNERGNVYFEKKNYDQAIRDYNEAMRLEPGQALHYRNRGLAHLRKKDYDRAVDDYVKAVRLDPENPYGYSQLAWLMATCPDERFRDGQKAVAYATRACALAHQKDPYCLESLAAACAEAGDFTAAVGWQKKALEFPALVKRYGVGAYQRLRLYEEQKPCRDD